MYLHWIIHTCVLLLLVNSNNKENILNLSAATTVALVLLSLKVISRL